MNLLRPHLALAYCNAQELRRRSRELADLRRNHEAVCTALVVLASNGTIRTMTSRARELLGKYFGRLGNQWLPWPVVAWLRRPDGGTALDARQGGRHPLKVDRAERRLIIRLLAGEPGPVLLLEEQGANFPLEPLLLLGLSHREAQVLSLMAGGKTDRAIGQTLGISFRTVKKHVEHILSKLGTENRTAASAVAHGAVTGLSTSA